MAIRIRNRINPMIYGPEPGIRIVNFYDYNNTFKKISIYKILIFTATQIFFSIYKIFNT